MSRCLKGRESNKFDWRGFLEVNDLWRVLKSFNAGIQFLIAETVNCSIGTPGQRHGVTSKLISESTATLIQSTSSTMSPVKASDPTDSPSESQLNPYQLNQHQLTPHPLSQQ